MYDLKSAGRLLGFAALWESTLAVGEYMVLVVMATLSVVGVGLIKRPGRFIGAA